MSVEGGDTAQEQERTVAGPGDGQVDGTAEEPSVNGAAQSQQRATDDDAASRMAVDDECKGPAASAYTPVLTLRGHMRSVSSLSISPDGQQLASSGADGLLKLWSIATGAFLATLDAASAADDEGDAAHLRLGISDVAWSKDGRYLVCGGDDCIVRVWDAGRHTLVRQFAGHTSFVFCVNFHPNVSLAVSGSFDETVRLWNLQRNTCHRTICAHSEAVTGVDFNRDGSILASGSYDGLIRLWDSSTGQCLKTLVYGEAPPIGNISFSPNSFQLLASSLDNKIRLWDIANNRVVKTYLGHQNEKYAINPCFTAYLPSPPTSTSSSAPVMIVSGSEDHRVYLWDLQAKKVVQTLIGHKDAVLAVATHPKLAIIASASMDQDACIKIWKLGAALT